MYSISSYEICFTCIKHLLFYKWQMYLVLNKEKKKEDGFERGPSGSQNFVLSRIRTRDLNDQWKERTRRSTFIATIPNFFQFVQIFFETVYIESIEGGGGVATVTAQREWRQIFRTSEVINLQSNEIVTD